MPERQPKNRGDVGFGETMDPNIRRISDNGRYVGILLLGEEEIVAEWHAKNGSPVRTSLHVLEAVVKERDRIVKERSQKK